LDFTVAEGHGHPLVSSNEERKGIRMSNIVMKQMEFRSQILLERPLLSAIVAET
jgi:hypothetical protein